MTAQPPFDRSRLKRGENRLPCPECDHGPRDTALAVRLADDGCLLWKCHRCGWAGAWREPRPETSPQKPSKPAHRAEGLARWASALWVNAKPLQGVPLAYLQARACKIPPPEGHLRCDPALWHPSGYTGPGLLALVTDARTAQPISLHRTWVRTDGSKAPVQPARMLAAGHRKAGGVIRLFPHRPGQPLGVCEGVESALALGWADVPVWAAIDAGNLAALPVLPGVPELLIGVDLDDAGERAAAECAARWREAGRRVRLVRPDEGCGDLNDVAQLYLGNE